MAIATQKELVNRNWNKLGAVQGVSLVDGEGNPITLSAVAGPAGPAGPVGPAGAIGVTGATGAAGPGVPVGGTAGQVLSKIDSTDFNSTWQTITGTGDVVGPAGAVNNNVATFNGTTGKLIKDSGLGLTGSNTGDQTITLTGDVTGTGTGSFAATIASGAVTLAKQANVATSTVFYRKTAGTGAPEVNTLATLKTDLGVSGTNSGDQTITLTGDVTGTGTGTFAATIANDAVTYAKMQNVSATSRFIGRITALAGDPEELTGTQATTLLDTFTTSLKGLAPSSGGGTTNFLRADGSWNVPPSGTGTVTTTGTPANGNLTKFSGATSVTNGDLTGDVTTSGTLTTTLANIPTGTPAVGTILHSNIAAPSNPASGKVSVFTDSTDLRFHDRNASGITGTTVVADTGASNNFLTAISAAGAISKAQPAFTNLSGSVGTTQMPALTGDVTTTAGFVATTIANNAVTYAKMQDVSATSRFIGRITAAAGDPEELTGTQATTLLDTFTTSLKGLAPSSGGGTTNFLRADGSWAAPGGSGTVTTTGTPANGNLAKFSGATSITNTDLTGDVTTSGTLTTTLANIPTATPAVGTILHTNIAAPSNPAAGKVSVFTDSTDLRFHDRNASGITGTTVVADTGATNNFLTAISAAGVISKAQPTPTNVGLGSVTNDAQTKAAIVPNTAPSAGQILAGNVGGTAYAPVTVSGSGATISLASTGVMTLSAIPSTTLSSMTSANLRTVLSDENGTGAALFDSCTSPTFITPILGTPTSGTLTNCTFPTLNQNTTGSAASLSVSGQTGLMTVTGLVSTNRVKTVRDAADTILELGGSYTPTGTWTSMTMVTPALGTPASGTLTNCTSLPVAGITASTSTALGVGSIELGHATDTTVARASAGRITVESVPVLMSAPRVTSIASNATWSPNADTDDIYEITAQAVAATTISNPSGTPANGQMLTIRATGTAARALTWSGTKWRASSDMPLPGTTTTTKTLYMGFMYNTAGTGTWDMVAMMDNF